MLHLVFFDEAETALRVLANPGRQSEKQLDAWGREHKALAVCNGGYFEVGKRDLRAWRSPLGCAAGHS